MEGSEEDCWQRCSGQAGSFWRPGMIGDALSILEAGRPVSPSSEIQSKQTNLQLRCDQGLLAKGKAVPTVGQTRLCMAKGIMEGSSKYTLARSTLRITSFYKSTGKTWAQHRGPIWHSRGFSRHRDGIESAILARRDRLLYSQVGRKEGAWKLLRSNACSLYFHAPTIIF